MLMSRDEIESRYPRILRAARWAACLTHTESVCAIHTIKFARHFNSPDLLVYGGGEAVSHCGGPANVVQMAMRCRHVVRNANGGKLA